MGCRVENTAVSRALLSPVFPGFVAEAIGRDGEISETRMLFDYTIRSDYMRGLAKLGFHYALMFLPGVRGDEKASSRFAISSGWEQDKSTTSCAMR